MDVREVNDLMAYWADHPPSHIAAAQLRDVVISAFGGKPQSLSSASRSGAGIEQLVAALGVNLEATGG
jgi:hypothetical protein